MPSAKDLKRRITTVKNTQQTTRAMKLVSAAKLRRAQDAIFSNRPYAQEIGRMIKLVASLVEGEVDSPLLRKENTDNETKKRLTLVAVASDRGLCGSFNANIIKTVSRFLASEEANKYSSIELAFIGRRGHEFFKTKNVKLGTYFSEAGGKVSFDKAKAVAANLVEHYLSGNTDEIKFIYNEFKNAVTQKVVTENWLPLEPTIAEANDKSAQGTYMSKPAAKVLLDKLLKKHFAIQVYRVMLESQAGEHGARMSAMENATKNAGEMIKKLTLIYNKQRQAGITKELLEIIAGSESQKTAN
jgi:F-type H+-transporting ATPase subunit gamma